MATSNKGPRKREEIQVSKSKEAVVNETATTIWAAFYTPAEAKEGEDAAKVAEANAAHYKTASDMTQKLFDALRNLRDKAKPVLRERRETDAVMGEAVGKTLADLQGAYVTFRVGGTDEKPMMDRVSMSKLRMYSQVEGHPYGEAANAFLAEHKVRFVEREGAVKGKKVTLLEAVTTGKAKAA